MCSCPLLLQNKNTQLHGPTEKRIKRHHKTTMCSSSGSSANISRFQTPSTGNHVGKALGTRSRVANCMFLGADIETLQDTPDGAVTFSGRSRNREQSNINTRLPRLSSLLRTTHFPRFTKSQSRTKPWLSALSFSKRPVDICHVPAENWTPIY